MAGAALDSRDLGTPQLLSPGSSTTEGNSGLSRKGETAENQSIRKGEYQWQASQHCSDRTHFPGLERARHSDGDGMKSGNYREVN